jgi:PAS domain S-box-containing protein
MNIAEFAERLVADTPDGILYADKDGVIWYWNAGCQHIFGFTEDEAQGQSLDIIVLQNLRERHVASVRRRSVPDYSGDLQVLARSRTSIMTSGSASAY